ncbi:MAG: alpha/beta fold hydrolase [Ilumatobacteraceae bacterium]
MATARINGTDINFLDTGGDGPVVILSHGFLMDHTMFESQVAELRSTHRVITWDERGFGGTKATGEFTYWDSARDVLGLMDHLGIESAIVGGMSQGGFLSMRVALTAPERVRALILIDTQAGTEDPANVEGYGQLHSAWLAHGSSAVQDVIAGIILGAGDWQSWFDKWAVLPSEQFTYAFNCLMNRDDITDRLGEISAPTLIVHGDADAAIPVAKAEVLRDRIAGPTELVVVAGGSHAANLTHPGPTNAAIRAFVDRLGR